MLTLAVACAEVQTSARRRRWVLSAVRPAGRCCPQLSRARRWADRGADAARAGLASRRALDGRAPRVDRRAAVRGADAGRYGRALPGHAGGPGGRTGRGRAILSTTAAMPPICVRESILLSNLVPMIDSCTNRWPCSIPPLARMTARRADVPVSYGDRSMRPGETITALRTVTTPPFSRDTGR